jgi:HK97 family phage major capsid protein
MTTAQPETVASWEEYLQTAVSTPEAFATAMADTSEKGFKARLAAYVESKHAERSDLADQVKEFTQAALVDMFRQQGSPREGAELAAARLQHTALSADGRAVSKNFGARLAMSYNPEAPGAKMDGQFKNLGEFIQTVWHNRTNGKQRIKNLPDADAKLEIVNGYSIKVPDSGGFLVPEEYRSQLLMLGLEDSIVMPRATVIPMNSPTLIIPTVDATSNVSSVFGGIVVYRTEEGAEFVESQAKFGRIKLDVTKQTALAYLTNEVIRESSPAVSALLGQMLPPAMAYNADIDFLLGTGAGEPLGALTAGNPGLLVVDKEGGQAAATIVWQNVLRMYARMLPQSINRSVWLASPDIFVELATMALNVGTGGSAVWLTDAHGKPELTLLGRPVIMTEKTPGILGAQGDLSLVDFSFYLVGIRDSLMIDTSDHVKFTSDQTTVRAIARNDGRPWLTSAITPRNAGPTLSPFVTLAVRA